MKASWAKQLAKIKNTKSTKMKTEWTPREGKGGQKDTKRGGETAQKTSAASTGCELVKTNHMASVVEATCLQGAGAKTADDDDETRKATG